MDVTEDVGSGLVGEGFDEVYREDAVDRQQGHKEVVSIVIDEQR